MTPESVHELVEYDSILGSPRDQVLDEEVMYAAEGRLFFFHDGRNAWHSTWVQRYPGAHAFAAEIASLKTRIEGRRVQGSKWYIETLPTIVFMARSRALLVSEINAGAPLERYQARNWFAATLRLLGERFEPLTPNSVVRFLADSSPALLARAPLGTTESFPQGPEYRLGWRSTKHSPVDDKHVLRLVDEYREQRLARRERPKSG